MAKVKKSLLGTQFIEAVPKKNATRKWSTYQVCSHQSEQ